MCLVFMCMGFWNEWNSTEEIHFSLFIILLPLFRCSWRISFLFKIKINNMDLDCKACGSALLSASHCSLNWFQNQRQIGTSCISCPFHFSHRTLLCVFYAVIYDSKHLTLQVLLSSNLLTVYVSSTHVGKCLPSVQVVRFSNWNSSLCVDYGCV